MLMCVHSNHLPLISLIPAIVSIDLVGQDKPGRLVSAGGPVARLEGRLHASRSLLHI